MRQLELLTLVIVLLLAGCGRSSDASPSSSTSAPTLVDREGMYTLNPGPYTLTIVLRPHGNGHMVAYELCDAASSSVVASTDIGGNFSRWYMYWSTEGTLWIYSGDTGVAICQKVDEGRFIHRAIEEDELEEMPDIPPQFFHALPDSLKRRWPEFRDDRR